MNIRFRKIVLEEQVKSFTKDEKDMFDKITENLREEDSKAILIAFELFYINEKINQ